MATDKEIKEAVKSEVDNAKSNMNTSPNVVFGNSEEDISYPVIALQYLSTSSLDYNNAGASVYGYVRNNSGEAIKQIYKKHKRMLYDISVHADDEGTKSDIIDSLERHFFKFSETRLKDVTNFHSDTDKVEVVSNTSSDNPELNNTLRIGDLRLAVEYHLRITESGTPIAKVDGKIELDNSGETQTYETT